MGRRDDHQHPERIQECSVEPTSRGRRQQKSQILLHWLRGEASDGPAFMIIIDTTNASLPSSGPRRSLRDEAEGLEHPFQGLESLRLWQPREGDRL